MIKPNEALGATIKRIVGQIKEGNSQIAQQEHHNIPIHAKIVVIALVNCVLAFLSAFGVLTLPTSFKVISATAILLITLLVSQALANGRRALEKIGVPKDANDHRTLLDRIEDLEHALDMKQHDRRCRTMGYEGADKRETAPA